MSDRVSIAVIDPATGQTRDIVCAVTKLAPTVFSGAVTVNGRRYRKTVDMTRGGALGRAMLRAHWRNWILGLLSQEAVK